MALRDKVISYRKEHLMTQKELASRCGVTKETISRIERGNNASLFTQAKIEKAMSKPISND